MDCLMIERSAFEELKTLVTTLQERAEEFRTMLSPSRPPR